MLSVSFVLVALIKRGGGKRPDEARQPTCPTAGRVPIPAEHSPFVLPCREATCWINPHSTLWSPVDKTDRCRPRDEGKSNKANPPAFQGFFYNLSISNIQGEQK